MVNPVFKVELGRIGAADDVYYSEVFPNVYLDVAQVVIGWQHETGQAGQQEVAQLHFLAFREDVLTLHEICRT